MDGAITMACLLSKGYGKKGTVSDTVLTDSNAWSPRHDKEIQVLEGYFSSFNLLSHTCNLIVFPQSLIGHT